MAASLDASEQMAIEMLGELAEAPKNTHEPSVSTELVPEPAEDMLVEMDADDRSSSLSDIEDRLTNDATEEPLDIEEVESEAEDTEAETERIEGSPQKVRKQRNINLKLSYQITAADSYLDEEALRKTREDRSSSISTFNGSETDFSNPQSPSSSSQRKRKRTPISADSESNKGKEAKAAYKSSNQERARTDNPLVLTNGEIAPSSSPSTPQSERSSIVEGLVDSRTEDPSVKVERSAPDEEQHEENNPREDELSNDEEAIPVEGDGDADAITPGEEESLKKTAAMKSLTELEQCFALLRDKLFDDRLTQYNQELTALQQPKSTHPEYLAMMECIDKRRDEKIEFENTFYRLNLENLKRKTVADRSLGISQYLQSARQIREEALERANEEWYNLQRERRAWNSDQSAHLYMFQKKRSKQIAHQTAYNTEVSILSGVAKYVGFPAAPEINGARPNEIEEDLRAIREATRSVNHASGKRQEASTDHTDQQSNLEFQHQHQRLHNSLASIAKQQPLAEEQFREQNPWANPQHPSHGPLMSSAFRRISQQARSRSPYSTPAGQKQAVDPAAHGSASTIPADFSQQGSSVVGTPASTEKHPNPLLQSSTMSQETPSRQPMSALGQNTMLMNGASSKQPGSGDTAARVDPSEPRRFNHAQQSTPIPQKSSEPSSAFNPIGSIPLTPFTSSVGPLQGSRNQAPVVQARSS
ncbi:hypothetical protein MMC25_005457 [Agyrium rufum]|nr:hypothetical protein [Agyrium rufum]